MSSLIRALHRCVIILPWFAANGGGLFALEARTGLVRGFWPVLGILVPSDLLIWCLLDMAYNGIWRPAAANLNRARDIFAEDYGWLEDL
jgi:hypothetical protein